MIELLLIKTLSRKPHGQQTIRPLYSDVNAFIPQPYTRTENVNSKSIKIRIPQYCIFTLDNSNYLDMEICVYVNKSGKIENTEKKHFSNFVGVYFGNESGYIVLDNLEHINSVTYNVVFYPDTNSFYFFHNSKCSAIDHVAAHTSRIRAKYEKAMSIVLNNLDDQTQSQTPVDKTEDIYLTWKASVGNLQSYIFDFQPYETKYIKYVQTKGQPMRTFAVSSNETIFARLGCLNDNKYKHKAQMTSNNFKINIKIDEDMEKSEFIFFLENQCQRPARASVLEFPYSKEVCDFDVRKFPAEPSNSSDPMAVFNDSPLTTFIDESQFHTDVRDIRDENFFQFWAAMNKGVRVPEDETKNKNRFSKLHEMFTGSDLSRRRMRDSLREVFGNTAKEKISSLIGAVTQEVRRQMEPEEAKPRPKSPRRWDSTATADGSIVRRPFEPRTVEIVPDVYNRVDTRGVRSVFFGNTDDCDSIVLEDNENRYEALQDSTAGANLGAEELGGRLFVRSSSRTFTFFGSPARFGDKMFLLRNPTGRQAKDLPVDNQAMEEIERLRGVKECQLEWLGGFDIFEVSLGENDDSARYVFINKPYARVIVMESRGYNFAFFTESQNGSMRLRKVDLNMQGLIGFNFGQEKGAIRIWKNRPTKNVIKLFLSETANQQSFGFSLFDCYLGAEDIEAIQIGNNQTKIITKPPTPSPSLPEPTSVLEPTPTPSSRPTQSEALNVGEPRHRILIEEDIPDIKLPLDNNVDIQDNNPKGGGLWVATLILIVFFLCTCVIYACIRGMDRTVPKYSLI